ncbi:MAG: PrgI family protein, partial [Patescibacteria group bacterium]
QFVVPQFIDVESKIIGPISVRQFIILLVAGGFLFLWYSIFSFWFFAILGSLTMGIAVVIAFVKVNGQTFHIFALLMVQTRIRPKLKVWNRQDYIKIKTKEKKEKKEEHVTPKEVTQSRLTELSLMVDTEGAYQAPKNKKNTDNNIKNK